MQANLVFTPFAKPVPPLGIASLKSYVEAKSEHKVKCFDLNALYHNDLIDDVHYKRGKMNFSEQDRAVFLRAVDTFSNKNGEMFNQAIFDSSANTLFEGCFDNINKFFNKELGQAEKGRAAVPWFINKYVNLLLADNPDVIGFSIMLGEQISFSLVMAGIIKQRNRNIKIIFGGNAATMTYKKLLTYSYIDYIVLDEGEKAFLDLLNALDGQKPIGSIKNLAYRDGQMLIESERELIKDLNELPIPDFSDFDLYSYFIPEPVVSVLGTRGCFWRRCAFCTHYKSYSNKYRIMSVSRLVDHLEYYVQRGIRYFNFVDEMIPAGRYRKISEEIIKRGLQIYHYSLAKPTADFTKETFELMYKAGCRYIIWGVESGCQRILDLIDKGTNVRDIAKVLEYSASAGIKNHTFIIVGFPSETKQELEETLSFLYENRKNIHAIHNGPFILHENTPIFSNLAKYHIARAYTERYPEILRFQANRIEYDVTDGLSSMDAERYNLFYEKNFFDNFNYYSGIIRALRNHALYIYANEDKLIFNKIRKPIVNPLELREQSEMLSAACSSESA